MSLDPSRAGVQPNTGSQSPPILTAPKPALPFCLLTPDELLLLESLLSRARHLAGVERCAIADAIHIGDVVQLRPGADAHWESSLLLVCRIHDDGSVSGQILRPHRGGYREAWWRYTVPEVARVGRMPYPEPGLAIRSWAYDGPPCAACGGRKPVQRETRKHRTAKSG